MTNPFLGFDTPSSLTFGILLFSYILGSIPFGFFIARILKVKNLTSQGSGNTGATNVSRIVGFWPAGLITFLLDASKGILAVLLATPLGIRFILMLLHGIQGTDGADAGGAGNLELNVIEMWAAGLFAVLGHCYSPWIHFKGGKGVATGLGVFLILSPVSALFGIVGFLLVFLYKETVSLASIAGVILTSVAFLVLNQIGAYYWVAISLLFLILIRHEPNIDALLENKEKPFK